MKAGAAGIAGGGLLALSLAAVNTWAEEEEGAVPFFDDRWPAACLEVAQPATHWVGGHRMLPLACGLASQSPSSLSVVGVITPADAQLSILIVSTMAD